MKVHNANTTIPPIPSDVMIPVFTPKPKVWPKPTDQIDTWLDTQGFYRKHIARDESCLFRCVSEQIFLTQVHHLTVRNHCIKFALNQPEIFKQLTDIPVNNYVDRLCKRQMGTALDMEIISRLYSVDFVMYKEIRKPIEQVTSNGYNSYIMLSLSYDNHYDSVYPKQHISNSAICQSILYEALYKNVFKLEEVDYAVNKMLHDKTARYQPDLTPAFFSTGFQMRLEMRDNCKNVKDLLDYGITPFPYKVAKSLDPIIYRNVEYDTWSEQKKIKRHNMMTWNSKELQEGTKCWVNFKNESEAVKRVGYIQKMSPNKGPVEVFIQELGEKITVPHESLELIQNSICMGQSDTIMDMFGKFNNCNESKSHYSNVDENIDNSTKMRDSYQSDCVSSTSDLCSVQYMHPNSSTVPTSCYACISSRNYPMENDVKPIQYPNSDQEISKYPQATQHPNESTNVHEQPVPVVQYPVPYYPAMPQDVEVQPSYSSNALPPKPASNPNELNDATNPVRVFCNNNVDQYYRCGLPSVPYYIISPNYVYPVNPEPPVGLPPNTDIRRLQYSPPTVSQHQNEFVYAMPLNTISNSKAEMPVYPPVITYSNVSSVKKPIPRNNNTGDIVNTTESPPYRPYKEMVCLKEPPPVTTNVNIPGIPAPNIPTNIYPYYANPYPSITPPLYYHSIDYNGACYPTYSEVPAYPENITPPAYHVPQIVPVAYPEDVYQQISQVICQPMVPASH